MNAPRDAMELPLDGIRVVEASAGTGKTFTIATLYLRLILERGLQVDEIVVATFTRAAAAELSTRLRERLVIADDLLAQVGPADERAGEEGGHIAAREVIAQAVRAGITPGELRRRAHDARLAIDTAFIGTLHGFCHRALAEFGFDTGQVLAQPELIDDLHELQTGIVRDFWRRGSVDPEAALLLAEAWTSPEGLAEQVCDPRWRGRAVELPEPDVDALRKAFESARQQIASWDATATDAFERELVRCVHTARTCTERTETLRQTLQWALTGTPGQALAAFDANSTATILPDALENLVPRGERPSAPPFDDLQALCDAWTRLQQAETCLAQLPVARLLRDARAYLEAELPERLAERNLMGHDQAVDKLAAALSDGERGERTATRIRARWKAALVDEFQDTDPRQWRVVETLFGSTTLVLVGDPKQAIYGFRGGDVFAWLQARAHAQGEPLELAESWRAGTGMCAAINALFSTHDAFIEAGIGHPDLQPAPPVAQRAIVRDGEPLAALQLWWLDPESVGHSSRSKVPSKAFATRAIQRACVAWIEDVLHDDSVCLRDQDGERGKLRPRHIAVLVNSNAEAHAMQAALGRAGVPASCNLRASVYASDEAADLALLLDALAEPDHLQRARAARASLLVGDDAAGIASGIDDGARQAALLEGIATWADAVQRHGPLPWLHGLIANAAPRLLGVPDGERRVANYLQLAELLQDLHTASFGIRDLAIRFARARVDAQDDADAARLRLDTDADAVTVSTVHAAKGLEYAVVLVPYAVLGHDPDGRKNRRPPLRWYHDRAGHARVAIGNGASLEAELRASEEVRAEDVRKFYVAVTRASALCVLPFGPTSATRHSAVHHLLHVAGREQPLSDGAAGCEAALRGLCERAGDAAHVVHELPAMGRSRIKSVTPGLSLHARDFDRRGLERDWQVWSFSRLVRGSPNQATADPRPGTGDIDAAPVAEDSGPAGAAFGSAVHAVFEQTDFAAWRDVDGIPDGAHPLIERALAEQGLAAGGGVARRAIELTGACVRDALRTPLPCGVRLCDVPPDQRKAEIEFHLSLHPARASALYALLHAHGYQRQRSSVAPERLHGLLTGRIDLAFRHAGRFHIVDWKTNRCAPYDGAAMGAEVAMHDYDLQWLLYTLALHRWLRQCVRDYDFERDVGEVYYLFVRGMGEGRGVHVDRPPRALIAGMDALFDGTAPVQP